MPYLRPAMRATRTLTVVGCHAGGEVGNVVVGGVLPPAGDTVFEQMETLRREGDWLRRVLLREPRGSVACHANLVVPPTREDCDAGFIIMEPTEYPAMSGSNTICVTTVLLESGMVEMREPETVVRLEAPAGVVEARAACRDGKCESVEFTNVPCFVGQLDAVLEVEGLGTLTVDVAYGGMWYAIADAKALGFEITPEEARDLSLAGEAIRAAAREQLQCVHPENPAIAGVSIVQIAQPWRGVGEVTRNAVVVAPGTPRPLGHGHGPLGATRRPPRTRADEGRRLDDARLADRFDLRRPDRRGDARRRPGRDRAGDPRQRLDHRDHPGADRPD